MKVYTIRNERIVQITPAEISKGKATVWIRSINPGQKEIAFLAALTKAPVEEFKEFMEEDERPRLEIQKYLQFIYRTPYAEDGEIITVPASIFIYNNIVVTLEKQKTGALDYIENLVLQGRRRFLFRKSPITFLIYFIDKVNDEFFAKVDKIADTVDLFREKETGLTKDMMEKVYSLSVTLAFFNRSLLANIEVLNHLRKAYYRMITPKDKEHFEELYFDALQILDTEKVQREIVSNLFNLQSIITSTKLNDLMKKVTLLALIMLVPTLIAGLYGMNVTLPLADNPLAFVYIIGVMVGVTIFAIIVFKLLKWL